MPGHGSQQPGSEDFEDQQSPFAPRQRRRLLLGHLPGESRAEELLVEILTQLDSGRQSLADAQWAKLPLYEREFRFDGSGAGTTLQTQASTRNVLYVRKVVAITPSASTSVTLQLAEVTLPLSGGLQAFDVDVTLNPSDVRRLTWAPAGVGALLITGEQLPTYGKLR